MSLKTFGAPIESECSDWIKFIADSKFSLVKITPHNFNTLK